MTTDTAEAPAGLTGPGAELAFEGMVIIEWPAPRPPGDAGIQPLISKLTAVYDALTGTMLTTVTKIEVHVWPSGYITADLTMFTGEDGRPLYDIGQARVVEGRPVAGVFPFWVTEMRVPPRGHA